MTDLGNAKMTQTGPDEVVWVGHPSQILNLAWACLSALSVAVVAFLQMAVLSGLNLPHQVSTFVWVAGFSPLLWWGWNWLVIKTVTFTLTRERLKIRRGPINFRTNEIELYRVRDFQLLEPIWLRPFGLSNILVVSSDKSNPFTAIKGVKNGSQLMEDFRNAVQKRRIEFGARDIEVG